MRRVYLNEKLHSPVVRGLLSNQCCLSINVVARESDLKDGPCEKSPTNSPKINHFMHGSLKPLSVDVFQVQDWISENIGLKANY